MQNGEKIEFLQALSRKGHPVPTLEQAPRLPDYLEDVLLCYTDLVREGEVHWFEFDTWAERHGLVDREYAWEVICNAKREVDKWHSSKASPQPPGVPFSPARK